MQEKVRMRSWVQREDTKISSFFGWRGAGRSVVPPLPDERAQHPYFHFLSLAETHDEGCSLTSHCQRRVRVKGNSGRVNRRQLKNTYLFTLAPVRSIVRGETPRLPCLDFFSTPNSVEGGVCTCLLRKHSEQRCFLLSEAEDRDSRALHIQHGVNGRVYRRGKISCKP